MLHLLPGHVDDPIWFLLTGGFVGSVLTFMKLHAIHVRKKCLKCLRPRKSVNIYPSH